MRGIFLNKHKRQILLLVSVALAIFVWPAILLAQSGGLDDFAAATRLGTSTDFIGMTARIINIALGLLGVLAIVIILYAGWLWLTSRGNEEQISKAKKVLSAGLIGLIIILTSYAVASFILLKIAESTGANLGGGNPGGGGLPGGGERGFVVTSTSPRHLAENVKLCQDVMATFNQELDGSTINSSSFIVEKTGGAVVAGTYETATNSATFLHAADFDANTDYKASVTQAVQNFSGKNLEARKEWLFRTGTEQDNSLPKVDNVYPTAGLGNVCRNPAIQAVFSEEMRVSRFTTDNIILTDAGGNVIPLKKVYSGSDFKSFTVYPATTLPSTTTFTVRLKTGPADGSTGITDSCSNPLDGNANGTAENTPADDYTWTFTTGENENCNPEITSVNPLMGDYADQVEITGRNLGITGEASFNGWWADANSFIPLSNNIVCWGSPSCPAETVRVKVPVGSTTGAWYAQDNLKAATGKVWLALATASTNKLDFVVKSPFINNLSPQAGGAGQFVTLKGWNFGNQPGTVTLNGINVSPPASCSNWWKDTRIVVQIPGSVAAGSSYDFQVTTAADSASPNPQVAENKNKRSNYELFQVTSDAPGPGICDINPSSKLDTDPPISVTVTGEHFGNNQGSSQLLFGVAASSPSTWNDGVIITETPSLGVGEHDVCATVGGKTSNCVPFDVNTLASGGGSNRPPQVVRSNICSATTQSPNPYINSTNACTNSLVSARFTEAMQLASFTSGNIELYQCNNDNDLDTTLCTNPITLTSFVELKNSADEVVGFTAAPAIPFANSYWYKGLVKKEVLSAAGVAMVADYAWYFRASGGNCAVNKVMLVPSSANLPGVGSTQGFTSQATATNCNILDGASLGWSWEKGNDAADSPPDRIDWSAGSPSGNLATIVGMSSTINGPAWVTAATEGKVSSRALVSVGDSSAVVPTGPPVITGMSPTDGRTQPNLTTVVTIQGRNFGSSGSVYFGDLKANAALCGSWSDTQIIIAAPNLTSGIYPVRVQTNLGSSAEATDADAIDPNFTSNNIIRPGICSMTPDFGQGGTNISIKGFNFTDTAAAGQINFPIYDAAGLAQVVNPTSTGWSNTQINFSVPGSPNLPRTADVTVRVDYGAAGGGIKTSNGKLFYGEPFISSISPDNGPAGSWVTIKGGNFGPSTGVVTFSGTNSENLPPQCSVTTWSNTQIVAKAPAAGSSGLVKVRTAVPPGLQTTDARSKNFTFDPSQPLAPGLCLLNPEAVASVPYSPVNLWGDRFTTKGPTDQINFSNKVINTVTSWLNSNIILDAPTDTVSGDVTVQKDVTVTVRRCSGVLVGNICLGSWNDVTETRRVVSNPLEFLVGEGGTTGGVGDLQIIDFSPTDGAANVCRNTAVSVTFDKIIDKSSVVPVNVQLQNQTQINMKVESGTATCATGCLGSNCNATWSEVIYPNGWQQLVQTVNATSTGTCKLRLSTGGFIGGYTYYDDMSLVKTTAPSVNLLSNGDFESGMGEWTVQNGNWAVSSNIAKQGSNSLLNIRQAAVFDELNREFNVVAGENYVVHAWVFSGIPGKLTTKAIDTNDDGVPESGQVVFRANTPLQANRNYRLRVSGNLKATDGSSLDCSTPANCMTTFTTGADICQISKLNITPTEHTFTELGTAQDFVAQAVAPDGNELSVEYNWTKNDIGNVVNITTPPNLSNITVSPNNKNGRATLNVTADGSALGAGTKSASAAAQVFLCEDPYLYEDADYNFGFHYCQAQVLGGPTLPNLLGPRNPVESGSSPDTTLLKELLFNVEDTEDVIGLRVYTNPDRLTPKEWLQEKQGSTVTLNNSVVDGYTAATGGQTVYVSALNVTSGANIYSNEILLSINQNAGVAAKQIFDQLVASWEFNTNLSEDEQRRLQADFKRLLDLNIVRGLLDRYSVLHNYTVPALTAGSYIPGLSTSKWNSWQQSLSGVLGRSLPEDPINSFGDCPNHDAATCWREPSGGNPGDFMCPGGSFIYRYRVVNSQTARLYFNPEFVSFGGSSSVMWRGAPELASPSAPDAADKCASANPTVWQDIRYENPLLTVVTPNAGVVTSADAKINCGASCTSSYAAGATVTLSAIPSAGYRFVDWSGCDPPSITSCNIRMVGSKTISALFAAVSYTLTLNKEGSGTVRTIAPDNSLNCGVSCLTTTVSYTGGPTIRLEAIPAAGFVFAGWGGSCTGVGTCQVVMGTNKTVGARFLPLYSLTVSSTGPGTVISNPVGISCGGDCTEDFASGATVTLTPVAAARATFTGWGGACSGTGGCTVTMDGTKTVNAAFETVIVNYDLSVSRLGTGTGLVTSNDGKVNCGGDCAETYEEGSSVTLVASPGVGSDFDGWEVNGSPSFCPGLSPNCTVNMASPQNVVAKFKPQSFNVRITKTGSGAASGTVRSDVGGINCGGVCQATFVYGSTVLLTPQATAPTEFTEWGGDVSCGGSGSCSITVTGALNITAQFERTFILTVRTNGGTGLGNVVSTPKGLNGVAINCGLDCNDKFIANSPITLTATAAAGSSFASWSGGGCSGSGNCVVNSAVDVTVVASFSITPVSYQLNTSTSGTGQGNLQSNPSGINCGNGGATCAASFAAGDPVTLTPNASAGSAFTNWTGDCSGNGTCTVTMNSNHTIGAVFTAVQSTVTVILISSGGRVTSDIGSINCPGTCAGSYNYGDSVTLTADPDDGYVFSGWSWGCSGVGTCNLNIGSSDITVYATFNAVYHQLTAYKDGNGSGSLSSSPAGLNLNCNPTCGADSHPFTQGTVVTLTATPSGGSGLGGWTGCDSSPAQDKCVVTMNAARSVRINFSPPPPPSYTVTAGVTAGGTVAATGINCPGDCSESYVSGTSVTLSASASAGYSFKRWVGYVCNGSTNPNCLFTITSTGFVGAEFASVRQLIINVAGGSGNVATNPIGFGCGGNCSEYADGQTVFLVAQPSFGYAFKNWSGDAASCGANASCTIVMNGNRNVTANFEAGPSLTVSVTSGGGVSGPGISCNPDCQENYILGTVVNLTAGPGRNYTFNGWGGECSGVGACSVNMNAAKNVTATFVPTVPADS